MTGYIDNPWVLDALNPRMDSRYLIDEIDADSEEVGLEEDGAIETLLGNNGEEIGEFGFAEWLFDRMDILNYKGLAEL